MASPASSTDSLGGGGYTRSGRESDLDTTASSFSSQSTFLNPIYKKTFPSSWSRSSSGVGPGSYDGSSVHSQDPRFSTSQTFLNSGYPPPGYDGRYGYPMESEYRDGYRRVEPSQHYVHDPSLAYSTQAQDFSRNSYRYPPKPDNVPEYTNQIFADTRVPWNPGRNTFVPPKPRQAYQYTDYVEERNPSTRSDGYDVPYRATNVSSESSANATTSSNSAGQTSNGSASHDSSSAKRRSAGYDVRYHPAITGNSGYSTEAVSSNSRSAGAMESIKEDIRVARETPDHVYGRYW